MRTFDEEVLADRPYLFTPMGDKAASAHAIHDLSRNGRHGAFSSVPTIVPGPLAGERRGSFISPSDTASWGSPPPANGPITIMTWLRGTETTGNIEIFSRVVFKHYNLWNRPTGGRVTCYFGQGNESEAAVSTGRIPWNDGRWHLWHWVRDTATSPAMLSIYIDGALDAARTETGSAPTSGSWTLEARGSGNGIHLAGVGAWDRALSPTRMRRHYLAGIGALDR